MTAAVYGSLSAALVVAVMAMAYGTQPPSLGVAEFAPAARQSLDTPPSTATDSAAGPGAAARRGRTTTTTAPATSAPTASNGSASSTPTTRLGRARQCFGDPPRQLPDPRSPACLATIFDGDNGGTTATGVTATEIRVAVPFSSGGPSPDDRRRAEAIFNYFNQRYEMYGRRLVPVYVNYASQSTVVQQRALAADIGGRGVFASMADPSYYWFPVFYSELARQGVISIILGSFEIASDRETFDAVHPYAWSIHPSAEQVWRNLSGLVCESLAGHVAAHAGASLVGTQRKFGVVAAGDYRVPSARVLLEGLDSCGVTPLLTELAYNGDSTDWTNRTRAALQRMKSEGVTTLICACSESRVDQVASQMDDVNFTDAEWLLPSFLPHYYEEWYVQNYWPAALKAHTFGLQPLLKSAPVQADWWLNAAREVDPAVTPDGGFMVTLYERLLVLAAGVQAAGPQLTPDAFGQGLMATQFPNSDASRAPYWLPSVGFGPGDHSFYNDYALAWWSPQASPNGPAVNPAGGSWCYLDGGARYTAGHFPADADSRFFNPAEPCR